MNYTGLFILAVDDHPVNRALLKLQLEARGLHVVLAKNGAEALACWCDQQFSLVITDCGMPVMDGYELTTSIREIETREELPRIPIIAWTASILPEDIEICTKAGMNDFLAKPATDIELTQILAKWLIAAETQVAALASARDGEMLVNLATDESNPSITTNKKDDPIFDPEVLIDMLGDNPVVHRKLIDSFLEEAQKAAVEISLANEAHDSDTLTSVSHKLKSSARIVGAIQFANACEVLERAGRNATWVEIQPAQVNFQAAFKRMDAVMAT